MINSTFAIFVRDKLKLVWLIIFVPIMLLIGFVINIFERYNFFSFLAPILLIMMASTIYVLKKVLKKISNFKTNYGNDEMFKQSFESLFQAKNRVAINFAFALMIFIYFICLYQLNFLSLNIMGCYTLFLGGGTFFIALIGYELHIRLTLLCILAKRFCNMKLNYNKCSPKDTPWLLDLYELSKSLRLSSFLIGLLFVLENALFLIANTVETFEELLEKLLSLKIIFKLTEQDGMLELYVIWLFIFITIILGLPIIALIQINSLHDIVLLIEQDFKKELMQKRKRKKINENIGQLFALLHIIQLTEKSLDETYLLKWREKILAISTSVLTCLVHILSLLNFYLSNN